MNEGSVAARSRITVREFLCSGDAHHRIRFSVRSTREIAATEDSSRHAGATYQPLGSSRWSATPVCPECSALAFELRFYDPSLAQIPASERTTFWLSADGQRLAVPGRNDALMPERYVAAGYRKVEAASLRDLERFSEIRAAQTGNTVYSEMNYSAAEREWHDSAELETDSEEALTRDF